MSQRFQPKNILEFFSQHKVRVWTMLLLCIFLLLGLAVRMYSMQVLQYSYFKTESDDNRIQIKAIPPVRGKIYDRKGRVLAGNNVVYNLGVVVEHTGGIKAMLKKISALIPLTENQLKRFKTNRRVSRVYEPVVLRRKLT